MFFNRYLLAGTACLAMAASLAAPSQAAERDNRWKASWTTAIQGVAISPVTPQAATVPAYTQQPDLSFALPNLTASGATDQTFRLIVKPDLWGRTFRIKLSNAFGTQPVTFGAASIGLQDYQANVVHGTNTKVTFNGGSRSVRVAAGGEVFSDAVELEFVERIGIGALAGRNLAVSIAVNGASGPASSHDAAFTTSYISPPQSGDVTRQDDDTAFPFSATSFFFLSELDVVAPEDTIVIVALGDSITDGTFSTLNGNDRWSNVMSRKLHERFGNRISVVNEAIAGNAVTGVFAGQAVGTRLGRDVLGVSGVKAVVWLEGINDLGGLGVTPDLVIAGYKAVTARLHTAGIAVIGATVTSSYPPGGQPPANSPLLLVGGPALAGRYGSAQIDDYRKQLNSFILTSGIFDGVADFSAATIDPATGSLKLPFVPNSEGSAGDYLHPNRYGYQVMGIAAAAAVEKLIR